MNLQFSLWGTLIKLAHTEDEHRYGKLLEGTFAFNYESSGVKGQGAPRGAGRQQERIPGGSDVRSGPHLPPSADLSFPVDIEHLLYTGS